MPGKVRRFDMLGVTADVGFDHGLGMLASGFRAVRSTCRSMARSGS
ncbi:hypothetical protein FRACA_3960006 [Frankia canadensis]|uniref:Uncharacterized protein n=1 Tax=Frankia canadensis TaxID=1836972 RepID=A0A2I2KWB9_9ACTN|nr:hypothetical protein FRACA_3960006 [Frankia canadensis]SOU57249.1 hypothetical protein FRACA_3960006 [Frankia canadensis]